MPAARPTALRGEYLEWCSKNTGWRHLPNWSKLLNSETAAELSVAIDERLMKFASK